MRRRIAKRGPVSRSELGKRAVAADELGEGLADVRSGPRPGSMLDLRGGLSLARHILGPMRFHPLRLAAALLAAFPGLIVVVGCGGAGAPDDGAPRKASSASRDFRARIESKSRERPPTPSM